MVDLSEFSSLGDNNCDGAPNIIGGLTLEPVIVDHTSEESRQLVYKDGDFCLFQPHSLEEVASQDVMKIQEHLNVMTTSLPTDEEVRLFQILITLRIKYWTLKSGCGVVTSFDTGLISYPAQVYVCLISLEDPNNRHLILCCLSKRASGLENFMPELDSNAEKIKKSFQQSPDLTADCDHNLLKLLQSWTKSITYLNQVIFNYQAYLPILLHSALINSVKFTGSDNDIISDLQLLVKACSVDVLTNQEENQLVDVDDEACVMISVISATELSISTSEKSEFSELWTKKLIAKGHVESDSFYLKAVINKFKLKLIQDVNAVKRMVRDAEVNYYALYKCYSFLRSTGNIDLLLKTLINDASHSKETETIAVLHSIKEYHTKQNSTNGGGVGTSTVTTKPLIVF